MPTVMIVGASRGIGLELARQYAGDGWRVHATTRSGSDPGALNEIGDSLVLHRLDVGDSDQIANLAREIEGTTFDVLIHNAGVRGSDLPTDEVMRINAEAPIHVAEALLDAVETGEQKKIVLMSSQMGARRGSSGSLGVYGDSKAALNDRFREVEPGWRERGLTAIVMHPGWVRTDMGGAGAPLSVEQSVTGMRRVIGELTPEHAGRFLTWEGREHPW